MFARRAILLGATLTSLVALSMYDPYRYQSICDKCGASRSTSVYYLPFTECVLFRHSKDRESKFSQGISALNLRPDHNHQWLTVHGGGRGIMCTLGRGHKIESVIEDASVMNFVRACQHWEGDAFAENIIHQVLDQRTSTTVCNLAHLYEAAKVSNRSEFSKWKIEQRKLDEFAPILEIRAQANPASP